MDRYSQELIMARFLTHAPKFAQRYWKTVKINGFSSLEWDDLARFVLNTCQGNVALHEEIREVPMCQGDKRDFISYQLTHSTSISAQNRLRLEESLRLTVKCEEPYILFQNSEDIVMFKLMYPDQFTD